LCSFESIGYEAAVERVRSELGAERFHSLWQDGEMIPLDGIIELFDEAVTFTENDLSRTSQPRD
jgi:hypothetical protein